MTIKQASAYVEREHGGWGWWALKVVVIGAGLVGLFNAFDLARFFN